MPVIPPQYVPGEPRVQVPFGLFSVWTPRPNPVDPHWEDGGIEFESIATTPASGVGPNRTIVAGRSSGIGLPKSFANNGYQSSAAPFTVYGSYKAAPVGHDIEWAQQQAAAHLQAREQERVEQALWTGDLGNEPSLIEETVLLGTDLDPAIGLGLLEQWLAQTYGSLGVLHMPRSAATMLVKNMLLQVKGNGLYTFLGTPVIAGGGYPGTDPDGVAPAANHSLMFASPNMFGYRSEVFYATDQFGGADLLDRNTNTLYALAERNYVLAWDEGPGTAYVDANLLAPAAD